MTLKFDARYTTIVKAISSEITSKSKIRVTVFENGYDDSNPEGSKL